MRLAFAAIISIFLISCESSTAVMSASEQGLGALSCPQIHSTFAAFERDRNSIEAARQLGLAFNIPYQTGTNLGQYYEMIKTASNVALLTQSCATLP